MSFAHIFVFLMVCLIQVYCDNHTTCTAITENGGSRGHEFMQQVLVYVKHEYRSNTNGQPFSDTKQKHHEKLGISDILALSLEDNDNNKHSLYVTSNGTHVCAAVDFLSEGEACADVGCHTNEPVHDCRRVCFLADDYNSTHVLDFYKSVKSSPGIGTWTTHDFVELKVLQDRSMHCYQLDNFYDKKFPEPVPNVTCPVGQMCRITLAYVQATSNPRYYIGCEENTGHIDSCQQQGCRFNVKENIPGSSTSYTWHQLCRYCCYGDLCNDVDKCTEYSCDLSGDKTNSGDTSVAANHSVNLIFIITVTFIELLKLL